MVAAKIAHRKAGAYTGEISAEMIASTGAKCVILGHSERRSYYGETSPILVKKVAQALDSKLETSSAWVKYWKKENPRNISKL